MPVRPRRPSPETEPADALDQRPSKSQRKRDSHELQDIGAELVELSPERLARIDMPDSLRSAIAEAQRMTRHEARRRQLQYVGKVMRSVDPAPLREALDAIKGVSARQVAREQRIERLRERLLKDEAVLTEIGDRFPDIDMQQLRTLRRNALREAELNKPPRAFREMFRLLRELELAREKAESGGTDDGAGWEDEVPEHE